MGNDQEDKTRLLDTTRSSDDDLEAFDLSDPRPASPQADAVNSPSYSDSSSLAEYKEQEQLKYERQRSKRRRFGCSWIAVNRVCYCVTLFVFLLLAYCLGTFSGVRIEQHAIATAEQQAPKWVKPEGFKVVGLVFYGRPKYVSILDCYLKRNLAENGGYFDEIHWMANTENMYDIRYLDRLVNTTASYKKFEIPRPDFNSVWEHAVDNNTLYIKIDDDIVYIHEDAVPRLVHSKLNNPQALNIAANIINSPLTDWFHHRTGAVLPYLPEPNPPMNASQTPSWRPSELIPYRATPPSEYEFGQPEEGHAHYQIGQTGGPPWKNHRWLPLPETAANLLKTPIARSEYNAWGRGWVSWAIGAQQQYSLFENIEKGQMQRYWFGGADGLWNMRYDRYNLNFLAIWGQDVAIQLPTRDDEADFTSNNPRKLMRPLLIDTHAIVAHFAFGPQKTEMAETDLLDRYRAYANEMVCTSDNQLQAVELHY